jgi:AraC-like DNA-binding protein
MDKPFTGADRIARYTGAVVKMLRLDPLDHVRTRALALAENEGHTGIENPALCLYRFPRPTEFTKMATFGVTLGVVLQGTKEMRVAGTQLRADPRQLVVITRDAEYTSIAITPPDDRPYLGLSVLFSPEQVAKALVALAEAGAPQSREVTPAFSMPLEPNIVEALERLLRTFDDPLDRTLIAPLVLDEILFRLLRSDAAAAVRAGVGPAQDATRILEAMQFIRANHTRKLSVEHIARKVAMSPSHFAHRFTAVARTSPMRYLREVRLERARALMAEHGARAGEVAGRVGFESAAHFTREFKRRFGRPPSQYAPR